MAPEEGHGIGMPAARVRSATDDEGLVAIARRRARGGLDADVETGVPEHAADPLRDGRGRPEVAAVGDEDLQLWIPPAVEAASERTSEAGPRGPSVTGGMAARQGARCADDRPRDATVVRDATGRRVSCTGELEGLDASP